MNLSFFISKRISKNEKNSFSSVINKIAIGSIAIGLAIMLASFMILEGFKNTITNKIESFGGELQVVKYGLNRGVENSPIPSENSFSNNVEKFSFLKNYYPYVNMAGLLKAEGEVAGVVFKGVGEKYVDSRFMSHLKEGTYFNRGGKKYSKEVVISERISNLLNIGVGDQVVLCFFRNPPRFRKVTVSGIYETGLEEFDEKFIIGDIRLGQKINHWGDTLVGGFELHLSENESIKKASEVLSKTLGYKLKVESVKEKYDDIYDWLSMLNTPVGIFLTLIFAVACFNMISIILILIMERTQMIGTLKALGASNSQIEKIFAYNGMLLIVKGALIGNVIGLGFGLLQDNFNLIPLDPESYYMSFVPIDWNFSLIVLVNVGVVILSSLILLIPIKIITKVDPIKTIKFD